MRTANRQHTTCSEVAATVAHLASRGRRPAVLWVRARAYLCTRSGDAYEAIADIDDVSDGDAALERDRATWAAVEAGASFRVCGDRDTVRLRLPCGRTLPAPVQTDAPMRQV